MVPVGVKGDSIGQYHHRAIYTDAEIDEVLALWDAGFTVACIAIKPENRGIYTQSDSPKKSSRNIWSLAVVSVDQRY